jgi:hypothetical protein
VTVVVAFAQTASGFTDALHAVIQPAAVSAEARQRAIEVVARIRRADYEGNREALRSLLEGLTPDSTDRSFASRVHYWRGFALWRRALNGFNQNVDAKELAADLERGVAEFEQASALDPAFVDAKVGLVSCLQNLAFVHRADTTVTAALVARFVPMLKELATKAPDNPRLLWIYGASLWYAVPGFTDTQIATRREQALTTYEHGLKLARATAAPLDPIEPSKSSRPCGC